MPNEREPATAAEMPLLPVMSVMLLLIPALLLAMEAASLAQISVNAPKFCTCGREKDPNAPEPLRLEVSVLRDGFRTAWSGHEAGLAPDIPLAPDGTHDFAALEERARTLKEQFPHDTMVRVTAEGDVELAELVGTMDALRGSDCKHPGTEEVGSENCLFWEPELSSS